VDGLAAINAPAAERLEARLRLALNILRAHPEAGHFGDTSGTREFGVARTPYKIIYGLAESVVVYRIIHGAMRWPPSDDE